MADKINDGGPAFPVADQGVHGNFGMTLRDWFAGQALAGLMADAEPTGPDVFMNAARASYAFADAMLKARAEMGEG